MSEAYETLYHWSATCWANFNKAVQIKLCDQYINSEVTWEIKYTEGQKLLCRSKDVNINSDGLEVWWVQEHLDIHVQGEYQHFFILPLTHYICILFDVELV